MRNQRAACRPGGSFAHLFTLMPFLSQMEQRKFPGPQTTRDTTLFAQKSPGSCTQESRTSASAPEKNHLGLPLEATCWKSALPKEASNFSLLTRNPSQESSSGSGQVPLEDAVSLSEPVTSGLAYSPSLLSAVHQRVLPLLLSQSARGGQLSEMNQGQAKELNEILF
nr:uncharacterized protein LOC105491799 [Macaca nemestrina]